MNRYERLAELLSNSFGPEYDIKYYENDQVTWEDVCSDSLSMIRGVCGLAGSDSTKLGGILVDTCNVQVSLLIPVDNFNDAIQTVETKMHDLHNTIYEWGAEYVQINNGGRTEAEKAIVNGVDYAITTLNITLVAYTKAALGNEGYIKIGGTTLSGVSNITYQSNHQMDGAVLGFSSPVQENKLAGIVKTITCDVVFCKDDELHLDLMNNDSNGKTYAVEYFNGFVTRTMTMRVLSLTEYVPMGNTIKGQIQLGGK